MFKRMPENLLEVVCDCAGPFVDDVMIASGHPVGGDQEGSQEGIGVGREIHPGLRGHEKGHSRCSGVASSGP